MNEYEHQRFRDWEVACVQKDAAIDKLTAERDLFAEAGRAAELRIVELKAEVDEWKRTAQSRQQRTSELLADNERLRAEWDRTLKAAERYNVRLTELREAAETLATSWDEDYISANGYLFANELRALLAKLTPWSKAVSGWRDDCEHRNSTLNVEGMLVCGDCGKIEREDGWVESADDTITMRTFQHRGEEPEHWVKLEDVAELVKAAEAVSKAADDAELETLCEPHNVAMSDAMEALRKAIKPFERP